MDFLYVLEKLRAPWLDAVMSAITELGGETAFLVAALVLFWCADKRQGYYLMAVGFLGTLANQFLKLACRIPRPWVRDPEFTIVEAARADAGGYSFPSGHSQTSVGTFGALAMGTRNKWLRGACIAVCVLVPFSRMYLGVHTPADVLVGSGMAIAFLVVLRPVVYSREGKNIPILFAVMIALGAAFVAYTELYPFPADIDQDNLQSAVKNSYTLMGALLGMVAVYFVDEKKLRFPTGGVWYAQVLKVLGGLALVLLVKEGTKAPLDALFAGHMIARAVRYCLVVLAAGMVWPLTFPWFARLGRKDAPA